MNSSTIQVKRKRVKHLKHAKNQEGEHKTNALKTANSLGEHWEQAQAKEHQFQLINYNNFNFAFYVEEQIVQMEESPVKSTLQELKKKNQKFLDARFPPNQNSLCGQWRYVTQWEEVKWQRISYALPKAKIFRARPKANEIKQGALGDCYFLAGLAAICEKPDRIYNLFLQRQNEQKHYQVKILYKGKWMMIDMDEYIPILPTKKQLYDPAFSKSIDNSLWVILLEKAWAKLYTSYKRIESGFPQQALHDLTGAPIYTINLSAASNNRQNQWNYLLKATQLQYAMVCSSKPGSDTQTSYSGIVQGHAYTLLAATVLDFKGKKYRLIKLRNPWGDVEYRQKWSDYDNTWDEVNPVDKQRLGYKKDVADGIFFMGFEQFCKEFKSITIGEINDDASYVYKSAKDPKLEGCYFRVQIAVNGTYSLLVDKTPQRSFQDKRQDSYNYPRATIDICVIEKNMARRLQRCQNNLRTTYLKCRMDPGIYIVKVLVEFNKNFETQFDVNLAIYAQYSCSIQLASNKQASIMEGRPVRWKGEQEKVPNMWNRLSAWEQKIPQKQPFVLDFNGNWMF